MTEPDLISNASTKSTSSKKINPLRQFIDNTMNNNYSTMNVIDKPNNTDNNNSSTVTVSKEFQENVIKFITYDDAIRSKDEEIKELKKLKTPFEKFVLEYLSKLGEDAIDITSGYLKINKNESKTPVTRDSIKEVIKKKIEDPKIIEEILEDIEKSRQVKTNIVLKRTFNKNDAPKKQPRTKKK